MASIALGFHFSSPEISQKMLKSLNCLLLGLFLKCFLSFHELASTITNIYLQKSPSIIRMIVFFTLLLSTKLYSDVPPWALVSFSISTSPFALCWWHLILSTIYMQCSLILRLTSLLSNILNSPWKYAFIWLSSLIPHVEPSCTFHHPFSLNEIKFYSKVTSTTSSSNSFVILLVVSISQLCPASTITGICNCCPIVSFVHYVLHPL